MDALERQALVLEAVCRVAEPLVRLLMREGLGYPVLAAQLKPVFLEQALAQIRQHGEKETDSALSLRSGIHRKDISAWRQNPIPKRVTKRSIPAEVFARWISDPAFAAPDGTPLPLPRQGGTESFEALSRSVNQDVHPLSVLNELLRLGLAELTVGDDGIERVSIRTVGFIPEADWEQLLALWVDNLSAHLDTAVRNLGGQDPRWLEQAAYAGGLSEASAQELAALSRRLWGDMLHAFLQEATRLHAQDGGLGPHTVRLGAYFHDEH
jgi:hypothetical protein